jgi:hypothetical protein
MGASGTQAMRSRHDATIEVSLIFESYSDLIF